ncbi:histidine kinase dimerization/phospho-acceptor domain-containing protein [Clostridium saccharoperbutylacetonicum]|uniref:histidine kinase dimerization/phospho-acceptor domain-containing protein n=1 Tax=Clostridium saccharoperbutylacetonicum TaxID=36745 RepID=UPI0039E7FB80
MNIENGLDKAIDKAVKSERIKGELITNVSHDLKTPLTSIINYVDLLDKGNVSEEKKKINLH